MSRNRKTGRFERRSNPKRRKKARKVTITRTVKEVRKTNPRLYMLTARKGRGPVLKYVKGMKFAARGKAVLFGNADSARTVASVLRLKFPALRRYTLSVV